MRVVIALDLDFFYGQVEQLRNPALAAQPFAVQQKHITVTCNYLARARGVRKLQLLSEARLACPELQVVNGEDISRYRAASRQIFQRLCQLLGSHVPIERLGLDEFFCDVTALVCDGAECPLHALHTSSSAPDAFALPKEATVNGHMLAAADLALALRRQIHRDLGFTMCAGIAHNKLLAKLVCGVHKPNCQTTLLPDAVDAFLGDSEVHRLNGFGHKSLRVLVDKMHLAPSKAPADETAALAEASLLDGADDSKPVSKDLQILIESFDTSQLTVRTVRQHCSLRDFVLWFGEKQARLLWSLLKGEDDSPVRMSSAFPTTISIEDSFPHCVTMADATQRLQELAREFVERLQSELVVDDAWMRYPQTCRLTVRLRDPQLEEERQYFAKRRSCSCRMPFETFDRSASAALRASILVQGPLLRCFHKLVSPPFDLSLINIGGVGMLRQQPPRPIRKMFRAEAPARPAEVPADVWGNMPLEIQHELATSSAVVALNRSGNKRSFDQVVGEEREEEEGNEADLQSGLCASDEGSYVKCRTCGERVARQQSEFHAWTHAQAE